MKVLFMFSLCCPKDEFTVTMYKKHSIPFCPPIGLKMYMDNCEHVVIDLFWHPGEQELTITLDGNTFDTKEDALKESEAFKNCGWFDDSTEHLMGD